MKRYLWVSGVCLLFGGCVANDIKPEPMKPSALKTEEITEASYGALNNGYQVPQMHPEKESVNLLSEGSRKLSDTFDDKPCEGEHAFSSACMNFDGKSEEDIKDEAYDKLVGKLFHSDRKKKKKSSFRLKRDRVEWKYKF